MNNLKVWVRLVSLALVSSLFIVLLFVLSENEIHRNNAFTRRFPHHPISKLFDLDINYNSYYLAGYKDHNLYLGNSTAPLHILKVNLKTKDTAHIRIKLDTMDSRFSAVKVQFFPPYFFVMDGNVPCMFRGRIGEWKAYLWMENDAYFSKGIPIDSNKVFIKTLSAEKNESVLGILNETNGFDVKLNPDVLNKQIDGVFDVDGKMVTSQNGEVLGHAYFYRNEFSVLDRNLNQLARQKTIDTVETANIKLSTVNSKGEVKMGKPPLVINKTAALMDDLMLIHSERMGKYEDEIMHKQAAIIDVYRWKKKSYEFSFYIYKINGETLREFNSYDSYLVALIQNTLSVYKIKDTHFKEDFAETSK